MITWDEFKLKLDARDQLRLDVRRHLGAYYKVSCGWTIWDNPGGALMHLEDTPGWAEALRATRRVQEVLDTYAYHNVYGQVPAWRQSNGDWQCYYLRSVD